MPYVDVYRLIICRVASSKFREVSVLSRTPPFARILNEFAAVDEKSVPCASLHTKEPLFMALAFLPAANVDCAKARLFRPPGTVLKVPEA